MSLFRIAETVLFLLAAILSLTFYPLLDSKLPGTSDKEALTARLWSIAAESGAIPDAAAENRDDGGYRAVLDGTLKSGIVVIPFWAEEPKLWNLPFPILSTGRTTVPEDFRPLSEIFVIAMDGLPRTDTEKALSTIRKAGFRERADAENFGGLSLHRLTADPMRTTAFRATSSLKDASVLLPGSPGESEDTPCRRDKTGKHVCNKSLKNGKKVSIGVRPTIREVNFKPFRCIDFMPQAGVPLRIIFRDVDLGTFLSVSAGPVGQSNARSEPKRSPLKFHIEIDGTSAASWQWLPLDTAEKHLTIETAALLSSGTHGAPPNEIGHTLTLTAQSDADHPIGFCFEAEAWRND